LSGKKSGQKFVVLAFWQKPTWNMHFFNQRGGVYVYADGIGFRDGRG
tara:strand:+ start:480 stop:620 length:141 start_codon:yes stop_codon:yes gene_type:complete